MKSLIFVGLVALCVGSTLMQSTESKKPTKVVCFWDSTSIKRAAPGNFKVEYLEPALSYCTHLVYGYAGIDANNYKVLSLNPDIDTRAGAGQYMSVLDLKQSFPDLKVYLSIGGNADPDEGTHKYLTVTETPEARDQFIISVVNFLSGYKFDGIDLAWQFPEVKVEKHRGTFGSLWNGIKKTFGYGKFEDEKETEHRKGFTTLVRDLENQLRSRKKALTLTVLPHVNASNE